MMNPIIFRKSTEYFSADAAGLWYTLIPLALISWKKIKYRNKCMDVNYLRFAVGERSESMFPFSELL
jgi:hypothetical protein